ncbi:MAG: hypothetical protein R2799_05855 [Crocinitomicaceae bacterium]
MRKIILYNFLISIIWFFVSYAYAAGNAGGEIILFTSILFFEILHVIVLVVLSYKNKDYTYGLWGILFSIFFMIMAYKLLRYG